MSSIYRLVHEALELGYLSIESEKQLRHLFKAGSCSEDELEVVFLRQAITFGHVKRQAARPQASVKKKDFTYRVA
jgi:hypothetical protein